MGNKNEDNTEKSSDPEETFEFKDLSGKKFDNKSFQGKSLRGADFTNAKIVEVDFGSSDLSGAKLPPHILESFDSTLNLVRDVSKNLRKICFSLIIIAIYIAFTLSHIEDQHLFIKNTFIELPIVNIKISSLFFLLPAQLLLCIVFLGCQIYRKQLNTIINKLPAKFPDGMSRALRLSPWIQLMQLNRVGKGELDLFSSSIWRNAVTGFLFWFLVPCTSALISIRTLRSQNQALTIAVGIIFLLTCFVIFTSNYWVKGGRGKRRLAYISIKTVTSLLIIFVVFGLLITIGIERNLFPLNLEKSDLKETNLKKFNLKKANLNEANLQDSLLCEVNLRGAVMKRSQCHGANFSCADLSYAYLDFAKFEGATFVCTKFLYAVFVKTNLSNTNLKNADFSNACLYFVDFSGANVEGAKFDGARIMSTLLLGSKNLTVEQLAKADTLYLSEIPPELKQEIGRQHPHLLAKPKNEESGQE